MALPKGLPILKELQRLKDIHCSSKVDSSVFQPKEDEQRNLIVKNSALKLVNLALKREKTKYIFNEKQRIEEDLQRDAERGSSSQGKRPYSSPSKGSDVSMIYTRQSSLYRLRPQTAGQVEGKATGFARVLKSADSPDSIAEQIQEQAVHEAKNAQKMFQLICANPSLGVVCQFSPKRSFEEVDVSHLVASPSMATASGNKMDALASLRKKDGILIIIDPSTFTDSRAITLKIRYMKQVDIAVEEPAEKEFTFWSNGNYFGLRLTKESSRSNAEANSNLQSGKPYSRVKVMLPGWTPAPPIFLPNTNKCSFHWVDIHQFVDSALVSNRLSRLRFFAISCATPKIGMKRVYEFVEQQMIRETANLSLPGGIPALHYAAMHGNINAVHLLVQNGANINFRCKEDKNMTALHEAVMAGQTEIAKYLLEHGASQLLRDDSGMGPLHLACKLGHTSIARLLMDHGEGKRALQMLDNVDHKPIDLCSNNFLKSGVENVMRKMHIFVKPRVSLYER